MPDDDSQPERLALALYAAVLDGTPIQEVLEAIRRATGADSAWMSRVSYAGGRPTGAQRFEDVGLDPAAIGEYVADWVMHDPWVVATGPLGPGLHNYDRIVPEHTYLASPFWNEFARRQALAVRHGISAVVAAEGETVGTISLQRTARPGAFGEAEERLLTALRPHLARAVALESRLAEAGLQAAAAGAGLDAMRHGVAIIARDGRLVRANAALLDMATRGDGLHLARGGPVAEDPAAQLRLSRAIAAVLAAPPGAAALATDIFPVPRRSGGVWRVQVTALAAAAQGPFAGFSGALVLVADPQALPLPSAATVQVMLGLTPAEADLALALAAGRSLADHARRRRVALETVRSHLASIRRKTGCRRQAELVAMVISLAA
jgi:DNA-binding CsgD family transcriptional regulator/GAF domain-containing protein